MYISGSVIGLAWPVLKQNKSGSCHATSTSHYSYYWHHSSLPCGLICTSYIIFTLVVDIHLLCIVCRGLLQPIVEHSHAFILDSTRNLADIL